jgi:hypothetical protein
MYNRINVVPDLGISTGLDKISNQITNSNPIIIFSIIGVIIVYYLVFSSMNVKITKPMNLPIGNTIQRGLSGIGFIEISLWGMFIFLLLINGMQLFLSIDIKAVIKDLFSGNPSAELIVESPMLERPTPIEKEVFHIPDNVYTYNDAKALCKAYNADIATYDQIKDTHDQGGEWCSYGWSKDQLALFPTQTLTYDTLKTIPGHENDCGRPGINGGFIDNPDAHFGVNCYGYKPEVTAKEKEIMAHTPMYPENINDKKRNEKLNVLRNTIPKINLAPFNKTNWSQSGI